MILFFIATIALILGYVFYGAMILEGFIAMVWATLGIAFYHGTGGLAAALGPSGDAGGVVREISNGLIGTWGGYLTVIAVVSLTITSGDTALRSARLSCAEFLRMDQKSIAKRLGLTAVILGVAIGLSLIDLNKIWLYFGWINQTLATFMLWIACVYLRKENINCLIALIPAIFMTVVCGTYFGYAPILLNQSTGISVAIGITIAICMTSFFFWKTRKQKGLDDK